MRLYDLRLILVIALLRTCLRRSYYVVMIILFAIAKCSSQTVVEPYAGVPMKSLPVGTYDPEWLRNVRNLVIDGDINAKIEYTSILELRLAPPPVCDQIAQDFAHFLRIHPYSKEDSILSAIFRLGNLRQSIVARRALSEFASATNRTIIFRHWLLSSLGEQLRDLGPGSEVWRKRRVPTSKEIEVIRQFLNSVNENDRYAALHVISAAEIVELLPMLMDRLSSVKDIPEEVEIIGVLGQIMPPSKYMFFDKWIISHNARIRTATKEALRNYLMINRSALPTKDIHTIENTIKRSGK